MAFTLEDGSGVVGANAYVSVDEANTYHKDRGNTAWVGAASQKQVAIVRATSYIEAMFTWSSGDCTTEDQRLSWPRAGAYNRDGDLIDMDEVPECVREATAELALTALTSSLMPSFDRVTLSESVGPLSVTYADSSTALRFPAVEGLLRGVATFSNPAPRHSTGSIEIERG